MFSSVRISSVLCLFAIVAFALGSGCARVSPAVGTWTGQARPNPVINININLTLTADGKGTLTAMPLLNNSPVTWKETGDNKVALEITRPATQPAAGSSQKSATANATIDKDGKTMSFSSSTATLTLTKQAEQKS